MTNKAIVKILDEINAIIIGLDERDIGYFFEKFGVYIAGYRFHPKVKLGVWDGKIRFFKKTGKTFVQLLPEIITDLQKFKYKLELIDNRKNLTINIPSIDKNYLSEYPDPLDPSKPLVLGDHQVEAVNIAIQNNIGIILAGTGAGKSIVTAILCRLYKQYQNYKCLIIVPTKDLVLQTSKDIATYGNDVGIYYSKEKDIEHDHLVSTWQSLQNNKQIATLFQCIVVDECQGATGESIREIINEHAANASIKLGLTGTLPKDDCDMMKIRISLGNVLYEVPAHKLIANGWLAKLHLRIVQLEEDLTDKWQQYQIEYPEEAKKLTYSKYKNEYFPDYSAETNYLKQNNTRNDFIVNLVEIGREMRGNCLVLVNGISYGRKLAKSIANAHFIYGKDDEETRKQIYNLFDTNDDVVLVTSYKIGSTGLNIRRIFNLFSIDSGRSFVRVIQSIGRSLRKATDKTAIYVYDIGSDLKSSRKHCNERKQYYNEQKYKFTLEKIDYKKFIT